MRILQPNFAKRGGLVVVITQEMRPDGQPGRVLMQAYTDEAGYLETLATGKAVYWSTSRKKRWCKGEESGNFQKVHDVFIDCDGDALIYLIEREEGDVACHTGAASCFYRCVCARDPMVMHAPRAGEGEKLEIIEADVEEHLARQLASGHNWE